ncbi:response regulator [Gemmatimonas sp.]|uniref:response regulator n=1 Tax=Gemmatimonas sp. TaxID=1962908 RepID=UPI0035682911
MRTASIHHGVDLPTFLLVEDSDEDADTVAEAFRRCGIAGYLQRVTNGDECLALLRVARATRPPALVLMDLNMPGMDGREALRQIKEDAKLQCIPVVITSTSDNPRDLAFCYSTGANAYHVKPVSYPHHLDVLTQLLQYWLGAVTLPAYPIRTP